MTKPVAFVAAALLALAGCTPTAPKSSTDKVPSPSPDIWSQLRRPLKLPRVTSSTACPKTSWQNAAKLDPANFEASWTYLAFGNGPTYPILYAVDPKDAVLHYGRYGGGTPIDGWFEDKVLWIGSPQYRGPTLVRGRQVDGSGELHFAEGGPGSLSGWNLPELKISPDNQPPADSSSVWLHFPSAVLLPGPGCYALQLDTVNSSQFIIFQAAT